MHPDLMDYDQLTVERTILNVSLENIETEYANAFTRWMTAVRANTLSQEAIDELESRSKKLFKKSHLLLNSLQKIKKELAKRKAERLSLSSV